MSLSAENQALVQRQLDADPSAGWCHVGSHSLLNDLLNAARAEGSDRALSLSDAPPRPPCEDCGMDWCGATCGRWAEAALDRFDRPDLVAAAVFRPRANHAPRVDDRGDRKTAADCRARFAYPLPFRGYSGMRATQIIIDDALSVILASAPELGYSPPSEFEEDFDTRI